MIRVNTKKIKGIPEAYVTIFKYGWLLSIDDGVGSVFAETGSLIDGMGDGSGCSSVASPYSKALLMNQLMDPRYASPISDRKMNCRHCQANLISELDNLYTPRETQTVSGLRLLSANCLCPCCVLLTGKLGKINSQVEEPFDIWHQVVEHYPIQACHEVL